MLVPFKSPLVGGVLIKRYQRFFADVRLESGEVVTAHCANTGSMKTCGAPGDRVWLLHQPSPKRKLAYTWELTETAGGYVGVNTQRPNQVVMAAVKAGRIAELAGYASARGEVKYGENSRIDLLLEGGTEDRAPCYVEVKNTTLLLDDRIAFPDAVTSRGQKHLAELEQVVRQGGRAVMLFFINRPEGAAFVPARAIDPVYADGLIRARASGVEILAYRAAASLTGIDLGARVALMENW